MKDIIVISAVNLVDGGPFSVLVDCLREISSSDIINRYRIIALVNSIKKMPELDGVEYIEFPKAKKRYFYRFYYEYWGFKKLSKEIKPHLWLSLHDMSPRVNADIQAVYMHNVIPFYNPKLIDWRFVPINAIWAYLYIYLYKFNVHSNNYLVVQQDWLRKEFSKKLSFPKEKIVVARPRNIVDIIEPKNRSEAAVTSFFYPAYPRVFKNFEVICEAAKMLEQRGLQNFKVKLTIDGTENKYSKYLVEKYSGIKTLDFVGLVPRERMTDMYEEASCLLFPSKLESWGLPLSEFKPYNKPMIVADLPYAHESVGGASSINFFDPENVEELALGMEQVISNELSNFVEVPEISLNEPSSQSWTEMFEVLLKESFKS